MPIKLNTASGGGVILTGANTASDKTITVPAVDGNMLYSDASGNAQINSGYGSLATGYVARAWVNFNGTGTVAIRASGNVSSITDVGTGQYGINFNTAMVDINYCVNASSAGRSTASLITSASRADLVLRDSSGTLTDYSEVFVSIFR